ncbi:MAG: hypothetical protein N2110_03935, partial [Flavobacteriales bacterium]|nr:hypothetical protein [Flavobacteriales bacterium]
MKKSIILLSCGALWGAFGSALWSQTPPQGINYQAVARDAGGNLITGPLTVRITLRQGSASGPTVYQETHNVTANTYGLFNLAIGQGSPQSGSFAGIDWGMGPYFAQVEVNAGSGFMNMGTQQLLSVPYALYAAKANMGLNDLTDVNTAGVSVGQVLKWDGSQWVPANDVGGGAGDNWGTQVVQTNATLTGNGTAGSPLGIAQMGATAGQVLKWNGTTWAPANDDNTTYTAGTGISISGTTITNTGDTDASNDLTTTTNFAGDVTGVYNNLQIASGAVGTAELANNAVTSAKIQDGTITGADLNQMSATTGQVLKWNGTTWAPANDNDAQTLSLSGNTLSISGGNSVTLPSGGGGDNWGTQVVQTDATLTGNGTAGNPLRIAQQGA